MLTKSAGAGPTVSTVCLGGACKVLMCSISPQLMFNVTFSPRTIKMTVRSGKNLLEFTWFVDNWYHYVIQSVLCIDIMWITDGPLPGTAHHNTDHRPPIRTSLGSLSGLHPPSDMWRVSSIVEFDNNNTVTRQGYQARTDWMVSIIITNNLTKLIFYQLGRGGLKPTQSWSGKFIMKSCCYFTHSSQARRSTLDLEFQIGCSVQTETCLSAEVSSKMCVVIPVICVSSDSTKTESCPCLETRHLITPIPLMTPAPQIGPCVVRFLMFLFI